MSSCMYSHETGACHAVPSSYVSHLPSSEYIKHHVTHSRRRSASHLMTNLFPCMFQRRAIQLRFGVPARSQRAIQAKSSGYTASQELQPGPLLYRTHARFFLSRRVVRLSNVRDFKLTLRVWCRVEKTVAVSGSYGEKTFDLEFR